MKKAQVRSKIASQQGITLIALVVTIVILLILAAITINLVLSDDGIIKKTQAAAIEHRAGMVEDEVAIWKTSHKLDPYTSTTTQSRDKLIDDQVKRKLLTDGEAEIAKRDRTSSDRKQINRL